MQEQAQDVYADQLRVSTSPYGVAITFLLSEPHPAPARPVETRNLATVRMSLEHAKVMVMIMRKQLKQFEESNGVSIQVPLDVLNQLGLSPEDWDKLS
jgi:hypothetical protein